MGDMKTSLPYAVTTSATNNQWYLLLRKKGEQVKQRLAFRDEQTMIEYFGFLLHCLDWKLGNQDVENEVNQIKSSDEPFPKREVGDYEMELERLPF